MNKWSIRMVKHSSRNYDLKKVLLATACEIAAFGWVSKSQAANSRSKYVRPTAFWVKGHMSNRDDPFIKDRINNMLHIAEHNGINLYGFEDEVDEAIDWAKSLKPDYDYGYSMNKQSAFEDTIKSIAERGYVNDYELGFACAILPSYRKWVKAQTHPSNHVGKVGEKFSDRIMITEIKPVNSSFLIQGVVVGTNNVVYWWGKKQPNTFTSGSFVEINAKIKSHDKYMHVNQTRLTGVKVIK